nr:galactokinase family protein [uncultured Blautia sp.]
MNLPEKENLQKIYGETEKSSARFAHLGEKFAEIYKHDHAEYFTSPGRTEIIGNHVDHNGGKVIAGSINLDTVGAAAPNGTDVIRITSEGYRDEIVVDLSKLSKKNYQKGTPALVAGMMEGAQKNGFKAAGFDAYVSTNVIAAAGVSSSASFEMLICTMIDYFFNEGKMTYNDYAKIGQYAENVYWDKASGMMDQMACAVGGPVLFNFADRNNLEYSKLDFSFGKFGYRLVIVNTGKGHADLSQEYSEIPAEMKAAAKALGVELLHESTLDELLAHVNEIEDDRAVLRAIHFFEETRRVEDAAEAIGKEDYEKFMKLMDESGNSSWELLQNCYSLQNCHEQKISLMLALTQLFLNKIQGGICRVHGGGFAGVIATILPEAEMDNYVEYISRYVGRDNVYPMDIRAIGAAHIG